jgi:hypothetical protein
MFGVKNVGLFTDYPVGATCCLAVDMPVPGPVNDAERAVLAGVSRGRGADPIGQRRDDLQ